MIRVSYFAPALAGLALAISGCEDPCDGGKDVLNKLRQFDARITAVAHNPTELPQACSEFRSDWNSQLAKGADFAKNTARSHFTFESSEYAPNRLVAIRKKPDCDIYESNRVTARCPQVTSYVYELDGYRDALDLSYSLNALRGFIGGLCNQNSLVATSEFQARGYSQIRAQIQAAEASDQTMMVRAGCTAKKGR